MCIFMRFKQLLIFRANIKRNSTIFFLLLIQVNVEFKVWGRFLLLLHIASLYTLQKYLPLCLLSFSIPDSDNVRFIISNLLYLLKVSDPWFACLLKFFYQYFVICFQCSSNYLHSEMFDNKQKTLNLKDTITFISW